MTQGLAKAIERVGTAAALARLLNISQSAITQWNGKPPVIRCPEIEAATGVSCHELRPDFFPVPSNE